MGKLTFGTTGGISYQCDKVEVKVDGAPKCPRCQERVYFNEEKKAVGKTWHTRCFTCTKCNKKLESTNYNQNNDDVLCTACYRKSCGPRVYGFVAGANLPTTLDIMEQSSRSSSSSSLDAGGPSSARPQRRESSAALLNLGGAAATRDERECCPLCGDRVYFAEELKALRRKWHRRCFRCQNCSKSLEPGRCSEHEGRLYCQGCYGKQFGPRGYGYSGGLGSLLTSDASGLYTTSSYGDRSSRYSVDDVFSPRPSPLPSVNHQNCDILLETETSDPMEPIRGTQEWTESVFSIPGSVSPRPANGAFYAPNGYSTVYPASSNSVNYSYPSNG